MEQRPKELRADKQTPREGRCAERAAGERGAGEVRVRQPHVAHLGAVEVGRTARRNALSKNRAVKCLG